MKLSMILLFFGVSLFFLSLSACNQAKPEEFELSFQSIERSEWGWEVHQNPEPALVVVTNSTDTAKLSPLQSDKVSQVLNETDFSKLIVAGVFYGVKGSDSYEVIVDRVTQQNNIINIYTTFTQPKETFRPIETSAYEIIVFEKPQQITLTTPFTFNLIINKQK